MGAGRGEQRTNIEYMVVTREVSQLSGWLKASVFCRGSQAGYGGAGRAAVGEAACKQLAGKTGDCTDIGVGGAGGEQRTENMPVISVTLEVFQLSGWLKAAALCRGSQTVHTVRCGLDGPKGGRWRAIAECARSVQG